MAVPTLLYSGMLMTENAFYPRSCSPRSRCACGSSGPTGKRPAFVLGAALLAYLTRAQAVAILPALAVAPFLVSGRRALREFRWFFAAGAGAVLLVVVVQLARGASVFGVFGAYEVAGTSTLHGGGRLALAALPLGGADPLARRRPVRGADRARADDARPAASRPRVPRGCRDARRSALVLEVATFASEQSLRVEERNMVYVAPLFLIALLLWIERGCPRPPLIAVPAAIAAVALPVALPYTKLIGLPAVSDTPALLRDLVDRAPVGGIGNLRWVVLVAGLAICAVFLFVPRRYALVLPLLVFLYFGISQKPIEGKYRQTSILDLFQGITAAHPDWIDRAVGRDAQVTLIWSGNTDKYSVWENEFFNRSVRHFYYTSAPLAGDLPEKPLTTDKQTRPDARSGRQGRARAVRAHGRVGRRRRAGRRAGRAQGDRPAADRRAAAPGLPRGRPLPAGHLVGPRPSRTRGSAVAADRSPSSCRATRRSSRSR